MNDLISIVIPAYNVGPYLADCLDSVLNQTYSNIEILLVDDGSADDTPAIADEYQTRFPDKIRVFHTPNQGVTLARFEGIKAAKGEWIGFVDGDDEVEPDMYQRLYENAVKYLADISHCGHKTIVNGGERVHEFYNTGELVVQDREKGLYDLLCGPVEPGLWSKIYRSTLILNVLQMMDTSIRINEDLLMNVYLFNRSNKAVYEDFCGYRYMARKASATRSVFRPEKLLDPITVSRYILDEVGTEYNGAAWRKYLLSLVNACDGLSHVSGYENKVSAMKSELKNNQDKFCFLSKKERIKCWTYIKMPWVYKSLFPVYVKYFRIKHYE